MGQSGEFVRPLIRPASGRIVNNRTRQIGRAKPPLFAGRDGAVDDAARTRSERPAPGNGPIVTRHHVRIHLTTQLVRGKRVSPIHLDNEAR